MLRIFTPKISRKQKGKLIPEEYRQVIFDKLDEKNIVFKKKVDELMNEKDLRVGDSLTFTFHLNFTEDYE